ncbi:hypothetical protein LAWI1_G008442 [Lachnellula willkommii]|uniref:DDE-1 domain-containing protein n=1 Tax=Lachnellula willkommii TaxID=215461 RepID=A0A559M8X8_9HELO|nr:hypothetical protein LAWI1_G008442 [Lachnellula willkommii]
MDKDKASWVLAQRFSDSLRKQALDNDVRRTTLQHRAAGRPSKDKADEGKLYLYPWEEKSLATFLAHQDALGRSVRVGYIRKMAFNLACQREDPDDRPSDLPYKGWPQAFHKRRPELDASKQQPLDWRRFDIYDKSVHWFEVIGPVLQRSDILPCNVWNYDETGTLLSMPKSVKVVVGKNNKRGQRGARIKRTNITAIECMNADGRYLNPMIIWPASTHRAKWSTHETPGWYYALSDKGSTDSYISFQWLKQIFDPETRELANGKPRYCFDNNIILCRIPSHTSHKLQPCDVSVFSSLKAAYREQVERLERGCVGTIGKEHFTYLYSPARTKAFTPRNIRAGWSKAGLYPFNPEKVLNEIPKPLDQLTAPEVNVTEVGSCTHDAVPQTPATPVSAEALTRLWTAIGQLPDDEANRQHKEKLQRKLLDGGRLCFAKCALLEEQNRFLVEINNESKVRRSTGSEVVGKAKVMLWQDIDNTRKELAAKKKAKAAKKAEREERKAEREEMKAQKEVQREAKQAEQAAKKAEKEAQREANKAAGKSTRGRKRKGMFRSSRCV